MSLAFVGLLSCAGSAPPQPIVRTRCVRTGRFAPLLGLMLYSPQPCPGR
jgi:hypothetical protein